MKRIMSLKTSISQHSPMRKRRLSSDFLRRSCPAAVLEDPPVVSLPEHHRFGRTTSRRSSLHFVRLSSAAYCRVHDDSASGRHSGCHNSTKASKRWKRKYCFMLNTFRPRIRNRSTDVLICWSLSMDWPPAFFPYRRSCESGLARIACNRFEPGSISGRQTSAY